MAATFRNAYFRRISEAKGRIWLMRDANWLQSQMWLVLAGWLTCVACRGVLILKCRIAINTFLFGLYVLLNITFHGKIYHILNLFPKKSI